MQNDGAEHGEFSDTSAALICAVLLRHREKLLGLREEAEKKISELEGRSDELQDALQRVTEDFQKVRSPMFRGQTAKSSGADGLLCQLAALSVTVCLCA